MNAAWTSVISTAIGAASAIGAGTLTQWWTSRREDTKYTRERKDKLSDEQRAVRVQLYLDLMEFTQQSQASLQSLTDPWRQSGSLMDGVLHVDRLNARVALLVAQTAVETAWAELRTAQLQLAEDWDQNDGVDYTDGYGKYFRSDAKQVKVVQEAISRMQRALRTQRNKEYDAIDGLDLFWQAIERGEGIEVHAS